MSARRGQYDRAGASLTPAFDLLFILTIAFLGVGIFLAATLRLEVGVTTMRQHVTAARAIEALDRERLLTLKPSRDRLARQVRTLEQVRSLEMLPKVRHEDVERAHREVAKLKAELASVTDLADRVSLEIEHLREQLESESADQDELLAKKSAAQEASKQTEQLEAQKVLLANRLAELLGELARGREAAPALPGAPMVRPHREAEKGELFLLSKGTVRPYPEFFDSEPISIGVIEANPSRQGLSITEALEPDSIVMKKISGEEFRRSGRAVLLVNPDSFAAFRAFRNALIERGIDYGWEPHEGTTMRLSPYGRSVPSQGISQ